MRFGNARDTLRNCWKTESSLFLTVGVVEPGIAEVQSVIADGV